MAARHTPAPAPAVAPKHGTPASAAAASMPRAPSAAFVADQHRGAPGAPPSRYQSDSSTPRSNVRSHKLRKNINKDKPQDRSKAHDRDRTREKDKVQDRDRDWDWDKDKESSRGHDSTDHCPPDSCQIADNIMSLFTATRTDATKYISYFRDRATIDLAYATSLRQLYQKTFGGQPSSPPGSSGSAEDRTSRVSDSDFAAVWVPGRAIDMIEAREHDERAKRLLDLEKQVADWATNREKTSHGDTDSRIRSAISRHQAHLKVVKEAQDAYQEICQKWDFRDDSDPIRAQSDAGPHPPSAAHQSSQPQREMAGEESGSIRLAADGDSRSRRYRGSMNSSGSWAEGPREVAKRANQFLLRSKGRDVISAPAPPTFPSPFMTVSSAPDQARSASSAPNEGPGWQSLQPSASSGRPDSLIRQQAKLRPDMEKADTAYRTEVSMLEIYRRQRQNELKTAWCKSILFHVELGNYVAELCRTTERTSIAMHRRLAQAHSDALDQAQQEWKGLVGKQRADRNGQPTYPVSFGLDNVPWTNDDKDVAAYKSKFTPDIDTPRVNYYNYWHGKYEHLQFGVPLADYAVNRDRREAPPVVVHQCIVFLNTRGLDTPGLYRTSGNTKLVLAMASEVERNEETFCIDPSTDCAVVASLLKLYLRQLPSRLVQLNSHQVREYKTLRSSPQAAAGGPGYVSDGKSHLSLLKKRIESHLDVHKFTLRAILEHLRLVAKHSDRNRMSALNLARIFGPVIISIEQPATPVPNLQLSTKPIKETDVSDASRSRPASPPAVLHPVAAHPHSERQGEVASIHEMENLDMVNIIAEDMINNFNYLFPEDSMPGPHRPTSMGPPSAGDQVQSQSQTPGGNQTQTRSRPSSGRSKLGVSDPGFSSGQETSADRTVIPQPGPQAHLVKLQAPRPLRPPGPSHTDPTMAVGMVMPLRASHRPKSRSLQHDPAQALYGLSRPLPNPYDEGRMGRRASGSTDQSQALVGGDGRLAGMSITVQHGSSLLKSPPPRPLSAAASYQPYMAPIPAPYSQHLHPSNRPEVPTMAVATPLAALPSDLPAPGASQRFNSFPSMTRTGSSSPRSGTPQTLPTPAQANPPQPSPLVPPAAAQATPKALPPIPPASPSSAAAPPALPTVPQGLSRWVAAITPASVGLAGMTPVPDPRSAGPAPGSVPGSGPDSALQSPMKVTGSPVSPSTSTRTGPSTHSASSASAPVAVGWSSPASQDQQEEDGSSVVGVVGVGHNTNPTMNPRPHLTARAIAPLSSVSPARQAHPIPTQLTSISTSTTATAIAPYRPRASESPIWEEAGALSHEGSPDNTAPVSSETYDHSGGWYPPRVSMPAQAQTQAQTEVQPKK